MGVSSAIPKSRCRASWTSAVVGAVRSVANVEHLLHYLPHRGQRIELTPLHLVQQPTKLRIVGDGLLQMRLRTPRRDREHLAGEILSPPLLEPALPLEVRAMLLDLLPQLLDVLATRRLRQHDRRLPGTFAVERQDRSHLADHRLRRRV